MSLKIIDVKDAGVLEKERVRIKVTADCNLNDYMVMDCTYDDAGQSSNKHRHVYFFPEKAVKKDEYVILYTCEGEDKTGAWSKQDKTATHRFYWGLETTVWNGNGDEALILEYNIVDRKKV